MSKGSIQDIFFLVEGRGGGSLMIHLCVIIIIIIHSVRSAWNGVTSTMLLITVSIKINDNMNLVLGMQPWLARDFSTVNYASCDNCIIA